MGVKSSHRGCTNDRFYSLLENVIIFPRFIKRRMQLGSTFSHLRVIDQTLWTFTVPRRSGCENAFYSSIAFESNFTVIFIKTIHSWKFYRNNQIVIWLGLTNQIIMRDEATNFLVSTMKFFVRATKFLVSVT